MSSSMGGGKKRRAGSTSASASLEHAVDVLPAVPAAACAVAEEKEEEAESSSMAVEGDDGPNGARKKPRLEDGKKEKNGAGEKKDAKASGKKATDSKKSSKAAKSSKSKDESSENKTTISTSPSKDEYKTMTLGDIRTSISALRDQIPPVPSNLSPDDPKSVTDWATSLQTVIEQLNLFICCVSHATYKWGSDRSGAADQNLAVLSSELGNAQDQISSSVTPRLTNVLAPVVDLVISRVITTKNAETGEEIKTNEFTREQVDPAFLKLCYDILCRNAHLIRNVLMTNLIKIDTVIQDYLKATKKDAGHDSRGFAY